MPDYMDRAQDLEERERAEALRRHQARMARAGLAAPPPRKPEPEPAEDDA
jgi:hypothetical protein